MRAPRREVRHYVGRLRKLGRGHCCRGFWKPCYSSGKMPQALARGMTMFSSRTLLISQTILMLCSTLCAVPTYQTGKLISITDSSSNRTVGNSQNGSVVTVTDVEYRISVRLGDMTYVGSYWPRTVWSYAPTEFIVNDPIEIRIDGKHMFIKRPNGKELKTTIVQRIRAGQNPK